MPERARRLAALALLGLWVAVAVEALAVEPYALEVTRHRIAAPVEPAIKIAHLTDLHTRGVGRLEQKLLDRLAEEAPDLIVVTGDVLSRDADIAGAADVLRRLQAPLGVWAVRGNWDVFPSPERERAFYRDGNARFLLNQAERLRGNVWLAGFDDEPFGAPSPERVVGGLPDDAYVIALFHMPLYFDALAGHVDLALAGHTHGGQIRLPGLPPLWLPDGCGDYVAGWYEARGSRMYVSRGLGTSLLPARFLAPPELAIITVGG